MDRQNRESFQLPFFIAGKVIRGLQKGIKLGFPTANVRLKTKIPSGIYVGLAIYQRKIYPAAIYAAPNKKILETHLLGFSSKIYGRPLMVIAEKKIRESKKFLTQNALIASIQKDIIAAKKFYQTRKN